MGMEYRMAGACTCARFGVLLHRGDEESLWERTSRSPKPMRSRFVGYHSSRSGWIRESSREWDASGFIQDLQTNKQEHS